LHKHGREQAYICATKIVRYFSRESNEQEHEDWVDALTVVSKTSLMGLEMCQKCEEGATSIHKFHNVRLFLSPKPSMRYEYDAQKKRIVSAVSHKLGSD
jgi:hypothetical protein